MLNPEISSLSPSLKSKGVRFVSISKQRNRNSTSNRLNAIELAGKPSLFISRLRKNMAIINRLNRTSYEID